jgi:hypothetical protein
MQLWLVFIANKHYMFRPNWLCSVSQFFLQGGFHNATATVAGSFLGWHYSAATRVRFYGLLSSFSAVPVCEQPKVRVLENVH